MTSITTQYNPNHELNARLVAAGGSKTVYALVTPETEAVKDSLFNERAEYFEMFRDAWTTKQDAYHREFFDLWHEWSKPVVDLDRGVFPHFYPTNGASEALRHLIYDFASKCTRGDNPLIHVFEGEYEGYKAMAEAAGVAVMEWARGDWRALVDRLNAGNCGWSHLVFISQPSAIDGMVWGDFNEFVRSIKMPNSVVVDLTYVGAVPEDAIGERFGMNVPSIKSVVFSLSKPFGVYYDRVGGVFTREEDAGLYGNIWFKNLTSLRLGSLLLKQFDVFYMPHAYRETQQAAVDKVAHELGITLCPADVYILARGDGISAADAALVDYLRRPASGPMRVCLTPAMAKMIGMVGEKI